MVTGRTIKAQLIRNWSHSGFEKDRYYSRRIAPDLIQVIYAYESSIGTLEVELGVRVRPSAETQPVRIVDCDIRGPLGSVDGSRHLGPRMLEIDVLAKLSTADLDAWCAFVDETAICHFFRVFHSADACESIVTSGLAKIMGLRVSAPYRESLGLRRGAGRWEFVEGAGSVDPLTVLKRVADRHLRSGEV